jgi:hypothetical protein
MGPDSIAGTVEGMGSGIGAELTGKHERADLPRAMPFWGQQLQWVVASGGWRRWRHGWEEGRQRASGRARRRCGTFLSRRCS